VVSPAPRRVDRTRRLSFSLDRVGLREPGPWLLRLLPLILTVVSLWHPPIALLIFAAVRPLKGELWGLVTPSYGRETVWSAQMGLELLEPMALSTLIGPLLR
jgi:hypothetical protein